MQRQILRNIDVPLLLGAASLVAIGLIAVYSATHTLAENGGDPLFFVKRQIVWVGIGLAAVGGILTIDYRLLQKWTRVIYVSVLALLTAVIVIGPRVMGAERWLVIGGIAFQPSEIAKIAIIITLATHLDSESERSPWGRIIASVIHIGLPMFLILLQPDLGTALVFLGILFGMLYMAGARPLHLGVLGGFIAAAAVTAYLLSRWGIVPLIRDYQMQRLMVFLNPYADRTGAGWNVIQSMVAVGSGGFFGKGAFQGSQTQLDFLPARHTDFIFSVIGEEFGFVGAFLLLALYLFILLRLLRTIQLAKDRFGVLLVAGVVSMIFFHVLVNVGMTLGIMPVTGLPLPFVSVGGSSLLTNFVALGLVLNVYQRRRKIQFGAV